MINYFDLLGLPVSFDTDLTQLESAYFGAQRQYHPDRFVTKSSEERAKAAGLSANVNDAYHTLKTPLKRAQHLLALSGVTILDEANSTKPDKALLMEVMELQEAIAEGNKPDISALIAETLKNLSQSFKNNDLEAAKTSTIRLSYLTKMA